MRSLEECIEACLNSLHACEICATKCIEMGDKSHADCIKNCRDCADICNLCLKWLSRQSAFAEDLCKLCAKICEACANECDKHDHEHCRRCAEACRRCVEACS
jgi:hypothetical protein